MRKMTPVALTIPKSHVNSAKYGLFPFYILVVLIVVVACIC